MNEVFQIAEQLVSETAYPCALATLVKVEGSSYRRTGARRLLIPDRHSLGAISGGCLEQDIDAHAANLIHSPNCYKLVTYDTTSENDTLWGTGTGCHGIVHILIEKLESCPEWAERVCQAREHRKMVCLRTIWESGDGAEENIGTAEERPKITYPETSYLHEIRPPRRLIIFGAGDDAIPLHRLANQLGWETKIFDPRPGFAAPARFRGAASVQCLPAEKSATAVEWDDDTVAVIMTHHYRFDLPLLQTLLPLHLPYLGLLGPKQRGQRLLKDAGLSSAPGILHNPVGLDLGGDGAEDVALAILSEIQAHLNRRTAASLSERDKPIHEEA